LSQNEVDVLFNIFARLLLSSANFKVEKKMKVRFGFSAEKRFGNEVDVFFSISAYLLGKFHRTSGGAGTKNPTRVAARYWNSEGRGRDRGVQGLGRVVRLV
jgi:peptidoglycan/LPS O-acetylase OafA/YrhL